MWARAFRGPGLGLLLLMASLFCLVAAGFQAHVKYVLSTRGASGVATVVETHQADEDHYVVVELDEAGAGEFRLAGDDRVGSQIAVRYDPRDPQQVVRADAQPAAAAVGLTVAGVTFGVMGFGSLRLRRGREERATVRPDPPSGR